MKEEERDSDLITRFFDLALSEEELIDFEEKAVNDQEFQKKINTYKEANAIVDDTYPDTATVLRTKEWKKLLNVNESPQVTKKYLWKWFGGVAAGCLLLFSIWQLTTRYQEPDMDRLLADSWEKNIGLDFRTTRSNSADSLKKQIHLAFDSYQNKDYQSAISILDNFKVNTSNIHYDDALLLKGLSYYKMGNVEKGLRTLDTLANYPKSNKAKVGRWYLGLIYLEQGKIDIAKKYIRLPDDNISEIQLKE